MFTTDEILASFASATAASGLMLVPKRQRDGHWDGFHSVQLSDGRVHQLADRKQNWPWIMRWREEHPEAAQRYLERGR